MLFLCENIGLPPLLLWCIHPCAPLKMTHMAAAFNTLRTRRWFSELSLYVARYLHRAKAPEVHLRYSYVSWNKVSNKIRRSESVMMNMQ